MGIKNRIKTAFSKTRIRIVKQIGALVSIGVALVIAIVLSKLLWEFTKYVYSF